MERCAAAPGLAVPLDRAAAGERGPAPWNGQGPERGSLDLADAETLIDILALHTSTPESCLFCLWDGWGWDTVMYVALPGEQPMPVPDPVPPEVRYGPRVQLPGCDYLLYTGPVDGALAFAGSGQTPNLWWPGDRAWCVASDIDLCWSYVGGSVQLIEELIAILGWRRFPQSPSTCIRGSRNTSFILPNGQRPISSPSARRVSKPGAARSGRRCAGPAGWDAANRFGSRVTAPAALAPGPSTG